MSASKLAKLIQRSGAFTTRKASKVAAQRVLDEIRLLRLSRS